MFQSQKKAFWTHAMMCCSTTVNKLLWNLHYSFLFHNFKPVVTFKVLALAVERFWNVYWISYRKKYLVTRTRPRLDSVIARPTRVKCLCPTVYLHTVSRYKWIWSVPIMPLKGLHLHYRSCANLTQALLIASGLKLPLH